MVGHFVSVHSIVCHGLQPWGLVCAVSACEQCEAGNRDGDVPLGELVCHDLAGAQVSTWLRCCAAPYLGNTSVMLLLAMLTWVWPLELQSYILCMQHKQRGDLRQC